MKYIFRVSGLLLCLLVACTVQITNPGENGIGNQPTPRPSATWINRGLGGRLILISYASGGVGIIQLDLNSGQSTMLYQAPKGAFLGAAVVSPDGQQLLLSYAPPPPDAGQNPDLTLYLLPADGKGAPQPIFSKPVTGEDFLNPVWAVDGKSIYATHLVRGPVNSNIPDKFSVDKINLDGQAQTVIANAMWPGLSQDGTQIAYVSALPGSTTNELYLADITGANSHPLTSIDNYLAVDDHFFTPDGKSVIFSAVNPAQPTPTPKLLDRFLGLITASAHGVPSDWYQISTSGNDQPVRLTNLGDTGMYAHLSPDGKHVGFIAQTGLYVMALDGSSLTYLSPLVLGGTLDWVP